MSNQSGGWMTIREAALALGVSELTVRRRIKDGRIPHRLTNGKYFVQLLPEAVHGGDSHAPSLLADESDQSVTDHHGENGHQGTNGPAEPAPYVFDLDALLAEYRRLAEMAGRAAILEQELRVLEERHAGLHQGALTLASRNGWLESKLDEREQQIKRLTASERKRPWWKRVFGAGEAGD